MACTSNKGIAIDCRITNNLCRKAFYVEVSDSDNNIVYKSRATNREKVIFFPQRKDRYKISVSAVSDNIYPGRITKWLKLNCNSHGQLTFLFSELCIPDHPTPVQSVDLILTDANYENLPISKGEINFMAYNATVTNGRGSLAVPNGDYSVTANVNGYDNTTIQPAEVTISADKNVYEFTIAANGTLTIHVTEDGTAEGTPVVGAEFIRTDSLGNEYGSAITTDSNGDAVFQNVPYQATDAPIIYYRQSASDGAHNFDNTVKSIQMTTNTETLQVTNAPTTTSDFQLTDANYANLPIESGEINLN